MKQMTLQAKRATFGGRAKHPSLGGFLYYCMTGDIL